MLPTYAPSQRLFFRYQCWSFLVLLMYSKYLQTDCIVTCLTTPAGIEGRITGLLFAKTGLATNRHNVWSSANRMGSLTASRLQWCQCFALKCHWKGKISTVLSSQVTNKILFFKGKNRWKKPVADWSQFSSEAWKVWVYFGCGRKDCEKKYLYNHHIIPTVIT